MIKNRLSTLLGEKRMSQKRLSQLTGIRPATINEMYHDLLERYSIEHIDKICEVLDCDINDLFVRVPNKEKITGKNLISKDKINGTKKN